MWTHIPKSGPVLSWIFCCRCCWLRTCWDLAWIWQCCFTVAHHSCRSQWLRRTLFQRGTAGSRRLSSALIWHLQTLDLMFVTFCDLWSILKIFEMLAMLAGNNSNAEAQLGIRASSKFWLTLVDVGRIGQTCGGKVVPVPSGWTHCTLLALYTCITCAFWQLFPNAGYAGCNTNKSFMGEFNGTQSYGGLQMFLWFTCCFLLFLISIHSQCGIGDPSHVSNLGSSCSAKRWFLSKRCRVLWYADFCPHLQRIKKWAWFIRFR